MNHHLRAPCAAVLCAAALASLNAQAQSVYKCTLDGKVSYGDTPCASDAATASTLAVPLAPAANPSAASELQRLKKESAAIEKERQKAAQREARDAERAAERETKRAAVQRKRCAKLALTKQWAEEDARRATAANIDKARLRAKRVGETMQLECPR
jgi:hypothetical protein